MGKQVLVQTRIDKDLKEEVAEIYEALGMDLPTAIRMFFAKSKMSRGIPFETTLPENVITRSEAMNAFAKLRREAENIPEMSLEEINQEIAASRMARRAGKE